MKISNGDADIERAGSYRSGAAARFAGVAVETLRVWERRYGVVRPRLSPRGQRLYSAADVRRLLLIKKLVDAGQSIGMIAVLPTDDLMAMREAVQSLHAPRARVGAGTRPARVILVGPLVSALRLDATDVAGSLKVVGRYASAADAARLPDHVQSDGLVFELPTLNDESLGAVAGLKTACGAAWAIVLYRFAPSAAIARLRDAGHQVVHAPADVVEIAAMCRALLHSTPALLQGVAPDADVIAPPAQFDDHALAALAEASSSVYCECPRHLVELVRNLGTFERYSAECANRSPADAALHRELQTCAARARAILESALLRVAFAEGLPLPPVVMGAA
ncbi:MAG: MerR family transcriptional regulator [Casimicrobiaceae bacterium]